MRPLVGPISLAHYRYPEEYFSGADVSIYIGNTWIDEVSNLSFELMEQVMPIFGYASRTYDTVARGQRIVRGSFSINFKESNYLYDVIEEYILQQTACDIKVATKIDPRLNLYSPVGTQPSIEEVLNQASGLDDFDKLSRAYEEMFWGPIDANITSTRPRADSPYFGGFDHLDDLDDEALERALEIRRQGFDILIRFGDGKFQPGVINRGATRKLIGVQLMGVGTAISLGAEPIREHYSFLAKDLI